MSLTYYKDQDLGIINNTPYDLYIFAHKNLKWLATDLATLIALLVIPILNIFSEASLVTKGVAIVERMPTFIAFLFRLLRLYFIIIKTMGISLEIKNEILGMGVLYLKAGNTTRGIAYSGEPNGFEWVFHILEPSMLIPEFNPYACDVTVHVLAIQNYDFMGYTNFDANRMSTWKPNLLSIPRDDRSDEDRPWISGKILEILDDIEDLKLLLDKLEQMCKGFFTDLPWSFSEIISTGFVGIWYHRARVRFEQKKYIENWKMTFDKIHLNRKKLVKEKLNGTTITLSESLHRNLIYDIDDQVDKKMRYRFKSVDNKTDLFIQVNNSYFSFKQSGINEFRLHNQKLVEIVNAHPLFEKHWPGLRLSIQMNYLPKVKAIGFESQYGGRTIFLSGKDNAMTNWKPEMIHIHVPSLIQPNPKTTPISFVTKNGKYFISNLSYLGHYNLYKQPNELKNWCFNVEYIVSPTNKTAQKFMIFTPGQNYNIISLRVALFDTYNAPLNLGVLENFIIQYQENHKTDFINPKYPY